MAQWRTGAGTSPNRSASWHGKWTDSVSPCIWTAPSTPGSSPDRCADEIIVATGSRPTRPPCPALRWPTSSRRSIIWGSPAGDSPPVTGPAVVIGANWIGCHAADVLAAQGYSVTVIGTHDSLGYDMGMQQGMVLRDRVAHTCAVRLQTSVETIHADRVTVWDSASWTAIRCPARRVVIASRMQSSRTLADTIDARIPTRVHVVGDAVDLACSRTLCWREHAPHRRSNLGSATPSWGAGDRSLHPHRGRRRSESSAAFSSSGVFDRGADQDVPSGAGQCVRARQLQHGTYRAVAAPRISRPG